jgi:ABC-type multidrug transport system ATPase subunit
MQGSTDVPPAGAVMNNPAQVETHASLEDRLLDGTLRIIAMLVQAGELDELRTRKAVEEHLASVFSKDAAARLLNHFDCIGHGRQTLAESIEMVRASSSSDQRLFILLKVLELKSIIAQREKTSDLVRDIAKGLDASADEFEDIDRVCRGMRSPSAASRRIRILRVASQPAEGALQVETANVQATFLSVGNAFYVRRESEHVIEADGHAVPHGSFQRIGEAGTVRISGQSLNTEDLHCYFRQASRTDCAPDIYIEIRGTESLVSMQRNDGATMRFGFTHATPFVECLNATHGGIKVNGAAISGVRHLLLSDAVTCHGRNIDLRKLTRGYLPDMHIFSQQKPSCTISNDASAAFHIPDGNDFRWEARLTLRENGLHLDPGACPHRIVISSPSSEAHDFLQIGDSFSIGGSWVDIRQGDGLEARLRPEGFQRVTLSGVTHRFPDGAMALDHISLDFEHGDLICVLGPSGCGKSTLLNVLSGSLRPTSGTVLLDGEDLFLHPGLQTSIGFVPQDDLLQENLTVGENLTFAARLRRSSESCDSIETRVRRSISQVDLAEHRDSKVGGPTMKSLSGGQRKRVNIGLELVGGSHLLLLDEPTSGLSAGDARKVIEVLSRRARSGDIVVVVAHQPDSHLLSMFNRVVVLDKTGKLAFFGGVPECLRYFADASPSANLPDHGRNPTNPKEPGIIFESLEQSARSIDGSPLKSRRYPPAFWQQRFELYANRYRPVPFRAGESDRDAHPGESATGSWFHSCMVLLLRESLNKLRGRAALGMNMISALVLGFAASLACRTSVGRNAYSYTENPALANFMFLTVIACLFLSVSGSVNEILCDRAILLRERMLRIPFTAYLPAKFLPLFAIYAGQLTIYLLIGFSVLRIPELFWAWWCFLAILGCTGIALGLAVSSIPNLSERAASAFVPLIMIPQIILAGADPFPFPDMRHLHLGRSRIEKTYPDAPPPQIAQLLPARWAFEGLVALHRDRCFNSRFIPAKEAINKNLQVRDFIRNDLDPEKHKDGRLLLEDRQKYLEKFGVPLTAEQIAQFRLKKSGELAPASGGFFTDIRGALGLIQWPWIQDDMDPGLPVQPRGNLRKDDFYSAAGRRFPNFQTLPWTQARFDVARFNAGVLAAMAAICMLAAAALGKYGGRPSDGRFSVAKFFGWLRKLFRLGSRSRQHDLHTSPH